MNLELIAEQSLCPQTQEHCHFKFALDEEFFYVINRKREQKERAAISRLRPECWS